MNHSTEFYPFGERLKATRLSKHITQQQLATKLGVHRNTISSWELGSYLPATRGIVLELARHLALDQSETRNLLDASLTTPSLYWVVPFVRNPFFTGREDILERLHKQLGVEHTTARPCPSTVHGLGGVGKTQIALEYAYRHVLEYSAIFWIGAETAESIHSAFVNIAEVLRLPEYDDTDQHHLIAAVQRWLSMHHQWLLIWDNVEDMSLLEHFLPTVHSGASLITTRCQSLGTISWGQVLRPMEIEEGTLFLLRRAKLLAPKAKSEQCQQFVRSSPIEYAAAKDLVTLLGGLPLAIDQAGAYIEETACGLISYLNYCIRQAPALLNRRGSTSTSGHPQSVTTTFGFAYERVEQIQPAAALLLRVCTVLQADAIPEELFLAGTHELGLEGEPWTHNLIQFDQVLAVLLNLSLIQRHPDTQMLSMHRLLQEVLRERIGEQEQLRWRRRVVGALNRLFPEVTYDSWKQCERLLPHVLACAQIAPTSLEAPELAMVLRKASDYLRERAQYIHAERWYQQALFIGEQAFGAEHSSLAATYCGLAILYTEQGKYEQAEPLYQQARRIIIRVFGQDHLEVAHVLFRLADLSYKQGKYEQAERGYQQSLHMQEQREVFNSPLMAQSLHGLAYLYSMQGKYEQAEPLYLKALHIREQALRPGHPDLGVSLTGLAILYTLQGKDEQAEPLLRQALDIWKEALGPDHPKVAASFYSLALTCKKQGKDEQAELFYLQALHVWEQALGPKHPNVGSPLNGLANLYLDQGKLVQAEAMGRRAVHIWEQALGSTHPNVGYALDTLATVYAKQGKDEQAKPLYERALHIWEQAFGSEHPEVTATRNKLTTLRLTREKGKREASRSMKEEMASFILQESTSLAPGKSAMNTLDAPHQIQEFLSVCCELRPLAWCRVSDLWQTYERWSALYQRQVPLSRRAFATQMKAYGCRADRTSSARIWRGICIIHKMV